MTIITGYIEHGRPQFIPAVPDLYDDRFQFASYWSHDLKAAFTAASTGAALRGLMDLRVYGDSADGRSSETSDYLMAPGFENTHILMGPGDELEEPTLEIMRIGDAPPGGPISGGTF